MECFPVVVTLSCLLEHSLPTSVSRSISHLVHIKIGENKAEDQNISSQSQGKFGK